MATKNERKWHNNFIKYTEFIVNHNNYAGIYHERQKDGNVKWVVTGKSKAGLLRRKWWDEKCNQYEIKIEPGCYATIARIIHPSKKHVCQICGKEMSIYYIYPTKRFLKKFNKLAKQQSINEFKFRSEDIISILEQLFNSKNMPFNEIRDIFKIPPSIQDNQELFIKYIENIYIKNCNKLLSPGVMSNSPDRLDGFHSDGLCCRSETDKGRHHDNLKRYSQDRRAYENWAGGDWNLANRLMAEFKRFKKKVKCPICGKNAVMTADHIGPISLGFTHRARFNPMCASCNSKKNNRMTVRDVHALINDENSGDNVISWHSIHLWDKLKHSIKNDKSALLASKIMRAHLHNVLSLLSIIKDAGFRHFLEGYLHPEYSYFDYKFHGFHPLFHDKLIISKKPIDSKNKQKNALRYVRISLQSLDDYKEKNNRRVKKWVSKELDTELNVLFSLLRKNKIIQARNHLEMIMQKLSSYFFSSFVN